MESDFVDIGTVGIIVLNEPLRPNIPDFDFLVLSTRSDASAVRMELNRVDSGVVIAESVDNLS